MAKVRWRIASVCALLCVGALCFSLQTARTTVAEEPAREAAADSDKGASDEDGSATEEGSKKPKNSRKETPARKKTTRKPAAPQQNRIDRKKGASGPGMGISGGKSGTGGSTGNSSSNNSGASSSDAGSPGSGPPSDGGSGAGGPVKGGAGKADPAPVQGGPDPAMVKKVMAIQDRHTEDLMGRKGVVGTSTGLDKDGNLVVRVYTNGVDKPIIPAKLDGIKVDVIETGPINKRWQLPRRTRLNRATPIGVSAFVKANICATGTLGCRLRDPSGNVYALSNNHVFALENEAALGLPIYQPGALDNLCRTNTDDIIGHLHKFVPIEFSTTASNVVDAAIMSTRADLVNSSTLKDGYGVPHTETAAAFLGQKVQKYGRTTGYRRGTVVGINTTVTVGYDGGPARFVKQIDIIGENEGLTPFSAGGDSGSLIVDEFRRPVALLFAGGGFPIDVTNANPIDEVLKAFSELGLELEVDDADATVTGKTGSTKPH